MFFRNFALFSLALPVFTLRIRLPRLHLKRRVRRALIRVILAALFVARAEVRQINVQGMMLSWFRFCPGFRRGAEGMKG